MNILSEIISSKIRAEIFRLLFGITDNEFHMREIERRSNFAIGTIQTELKKLGLLDLVKKRRDGNRLYFKANKNHPIYPDIHSLVLKTVGLTDIFREAMSQHSEIKNSFVFGSVATQSETSESDVDLMVIGDLGLRKLTQIISGVAEQIGREINPHILTESEFQKRIKSKDHFFTQIMKTKKIFIIGNQDEFEKMAK